MNVYITAKKLGSVDTNRRQTATCATLHMKCLWLVRAILIVLIGQLALFAADSSGGAPGVAQDGPPAFDLGGMPLQPDSDDDGTADTCDNSLT